MSKGYEITRCDRITDLGRKGKKESIGTKFIHDPRDIDMYVGPEMAGIIAIRHLWMGITRSQTISLFDRSGAFIQVDRVQSNETLRNVDPPTRMAPLSYQLR